MSEQIEFTSTGFTLKNPNVELNGVGFDYIYVAIAAPITRTQTAEEFGETQLKMLTYKNRKTVKEGEDALEMRQSLEDRLIDQGFSSEEVDQAFNPPNNE